ncbi:MAG TPA: hypothetical protein VF544_02870 [Pyrinomonadaceae bacterium]|jgi:hypothetical protein
MLDLSILDTLIAMVIVILVLSLVVQSLQTLAKKLLKLKSNQILNSLEDLFETITRTPAAGTSGATTKTPQELVTEVTNRLKEMGRQTLLGNPMLDSLAKGDLLKVLTRVRAEDLLPGTVGNFQQVLAGIKQLKDELGKIETTLLQGEASAKFAAMQGAIMPLIHDLEALASTGNIDPAVFLGDLYRLRQIKAAEVLDMLGQVQQSVHQDLVAAQKASADAQKALADAQQAKVQEQIDAATELEQQTAGRLTAVERVDSGLKMIAERIVKLGNSFDAAFAPLFARLQQVEVWYDTVMQGFDERYTRHMRTVALVISIGVVVILNANFFSIYRAIKADPMKTAVIAQQAPDILTTARQVNAASQGALTPTPSTSPSPSVAPSPSPAVAASPATAASPSPVTSPTASPAAVTTAPTGGAAPAAPSPAPTETPATIEEVQEQVAQVDNLVRTYQSFGIQPLTWDQIKGIPAGKYSFGDVVETILGWAIMVMLLSAGAPFWQDTLESLFGLKNLLRQKSDTKNVEEGKGGQPQP